MIGSICDKKAIDTLKGSQLSCFFNCSKKSLIQNQSYNIKNILNTLYMKTVYRYCLNNCTRNRGSYFETVGNNS